jgi:L-seryl-tRNA(Ser) seleniumtransferase
MKSPKSNLRNKLNLRNIPAIQDIIQDPILSSYKIDSRYLKHIVISVVSDYRDNLLKGKLDKTTNRAALRKSIISEVEVRLNSLLNFRLKRVINGTGIILHTNLGRAPLAEIARGHLREVIENYCNLEIELYSGKRGDRMSLVEDIICLITGAESAGVVNNNAAAVLLALNSLCNKKEVPVSRGELVEIGGSFRMPEVMKISGVKMIEVGTTNKTHLSDYKQAISPRTAGILKVHTSNYRVLGFTETVGVSDLVSLAHHHHLPLIYDMGSGVLEDLENWGYPHEPVAREFVNAGIDVITFSADKVLGGPQAGMIIGKKEYIKKIRKNHLLRALRCDKLTFALLDATLRLYLNPAELKNHLPVADMLNITIDELRTHGTELLKNLRETPVWVELVDSFSQMGSGALPLEKIPSISVKMRPPKLSISHFARKLRMTEPAVVGYLSDDNFYINLRTIRVDEIPLIVQSVKKVLS